MLLSHGLLAGLLLGVRHAMDPDHVIAISNMVGVGRSLPSAIRTGLWWGLGHALTVMVVGAAMLMLGLQVSAPVGTAMDLGVAGMLVLLGVLSLTAPERPARPGGYLVFRSSPVGAALVGVVHGLAGSAAMTLLAVSTMTSTAHALAYLSVFGAGTVAGMALITAVMSGTLRWASHRQAATLRWFSRLSAAVGVGLGLWLAWAATWEALFPPCPVHGSISNLH
jgi:high-affinity nickel permease